MDSELILKRLLGLPEHAELDGEQSLYDSELIDSFAFYQLSSYLIEQGRISSPRELALVRKVSDLFPFFEDDAKASHS